MIKTALRGLAAAALVVLPLAAAPPAHAAEIVPLAAAVDRLPLGIESREGYERTSFKHWNTGANPSDGCNTRAEVLISEAVEAPEIGASCLLSGGRWWSYYDATSVTSASGLDIDHMVPLAEAWDSGASAWTPQRREAYANDQRALTSLVAVTARSNRAKADKDPAQWMPPSAADDSVRCRYAAEWVGTKLRWGLAADDAELSALRGLALGCPLESVTYEPAV
ncbi:HNH endonuclease family protein [Streptomyces sp. NBC_00038]|uniref:HNH endonuclease family protein n=1 Tax=Streptomyces sp. NBC_00038 TaxID=2903615 RepID=UPI00224D70E0|nr:HNH endonuclease family protein [Streptomyces sp. NBC_00038]MCX5559489.1 HNH endonuclease family protein [Streptomyces sp. NBC_00038]